MSNRSNKGIRSSSLFVGRADIGEPSSGQIGIDAVASHRFETSQVGPFANDRYKVS